MPYPVRAIYENGVLRPLEPLRGVAEHSEVMVSLSEPTPSPHPLTAAVGILPDDDAEELSSIIAEEFERVDVDDWR